MILHNMITDIQKRHTQNEKRQEQQEKERQLRLRRSLAKKLLGGAAARGTCHISTQGDTVLVVWGAASVFRERAVWEDLGV